MFGMFIPVIGVLHGYVFVFDDEQVSRVFVLC